MFKSCLFTCLIAYAFTCQIWANGSGPQTRSAATQLHGAIPDDVLCSPAAWEEWLRNNPDNPQVLLFQANSHMRAGDIPAAKATLDRVQGLTSDPPEMQGWYAEIYRVAGDVPHELAALETLVKSTDGADKLLADYRTARILELRGDLVASRKAWQTSIENADRMKTFFRVDMAKFELCHGNTQEAITQLQQILRQENNEPNDTTNAQSTLSFAYWAAGQKAQALQSLQSTRAAMIKANNFNPELDCFCAMAAFTLADATEDKKDLPWADNWLRTAARSYPESPDSQTPVMALLQNKPQPDLVAHVRTVLKTAPHMEWALWSALVLRLRHIPDADTLPIEPNSIPGRLLPPPLPSKP